MVLAQATKRHFYKIVEMPHYPLFQAMGIREGETVFIASRGLLNGPTIIRKNDRHYAIGQQLAEEIVVEEVVRHE